MRNPRHGAIGVPSTLMFLLGIVLVGACYAAPHSDPPARKPPPSMSDFLAASPASDWALLNPEDTIYFDLPNGRFVMLLAPQFAPAHVGNIRALVRAHFFDGLSIVRVQDNYVVQWGDADSHHDRGNLAAKVPNEYFRSAKGLRFDPLPDRDAYAAQVGFVDGFPAARDSGGKSAWLTHCYGMVGVGRGMPPDNGAGEELYTVIGHSPRHLDRNLAVVGRIVRGIELLSSLPRGTGALGFYEKDTEHVPITRAQLASDLPVDQQLPIEALKTSSATFKTLIALRRNRSEDFFVEPTGHIDVCNMPLPVRIRPTTGG